MGRRPRPQPGDLQGYRRSKPWRRRVIVMDGRFSFIHRKRWSYPGGNSQSRSGKRNQAELAYLQRKWGQWITVKNSATTTRIVVNVERKWK